MAEVPASNLLAISAIKILAMDCMAPSLAIPNCRSLAPSKLKNHAMYLRVK
jgi:hypothetical protein